MRADGQSEHELVQRIAARAMDVFVRIGLVPIVAPSAVLMSAVGDSVRQFIRNVQSNSLEISAPSESAATWPVVGPTLHSMWHRSVA